MTDYALQRPDEARQLDMLRKIATELGGLQDLAGYEQAADVLGSLRHTMAKMKIAAVIQNEAARLNIHLQIQAGTLMLSMERGSPGRKPEGYTSDSQSYFLDELRKANINMSRAYNWQRLARYANAAKSDLERIVNWVIGNDYELTAACMLRRAKSCTALTALPDDGGIKLEHLDDKYPIQHAEIIPILHRLYKAQTDTFAELFQSGHLQPGNEEDAIPLWELTEANLTTILTERKLEHIAQSQVANGRNYHFEGVPCTPELINDLPRLMNLATEAGRVLRVVVWDEEVVHE